MPHVQVAVHFAELHDTPTRMKEKGCLRDIIAWSNSRRHFYWRLRRRSGLVLVVVFGCRCWCKFELLM